MAEQEPNRERIEAETETAIAVETETARIELTNRGAHLRSYRLRGYSDDEGGPLDLVRRRREGPYPFDLVGPDLEPLFLNEALYRVERKTTREGLQEVRFRYRGEAGGAEKIFRFGPRGTVGLEIRTEGIEGWGLVLGPGLANPDPESMNDRFAGRKAVYDLSGDLETLKGPKADELGTVPAAGLRFVGLEDTYFLTALMPSGGWERALLQPVALTEDGEEGAGPEVRWTMVPFEAEDSLPESLQEAPRDLRVVAKAQGDELRADGYFGAKEYERLASLGHGLRETIEWGIFGFLARPLLLVLQWIHDNVVTNYGWAIVLMTIGLKLLLFPLTHKGYVSMQKMQELQPQMKAIREKYRGKIKSKKGGVNFDAQKKMNEEMQALFKEKGASPTGGCWPMLLQIPVFFAFFKLLLAAVELRQEPWILWIQDLSVPDPFYVLPILMGATQILQQKLTPQSGDQMQRRIMQFFPWMFTIFALSFPSGLVLYWTVNNLLTIVQTSIIRRDGGDEEKGSGGSGKRKKGKGKGRK